MCGPSSSSCCCCSWTHLGLKTPSYCWILRTRVDVESARGELLVSFPWFWKTKKKTKRKNPLPNGVWHLCRAHLCKTPLSSKNSHVTENSYHFLFSKGQYILFQQFLNNTKFTFHLLNSDQEGTEFPPIRLPYSIMSETQLSFITFLLILMPSTDQKMFKK